MIPSRTMKVCWILLRKMAFIERVKEQRKEKEEKERKRERDKRRGEGEDTSLSRATHSCDLIYRKNFDFNHRGS